MTTAFVSLAQEVLPRKYRLTLQPDLENFTFRGEEQVELDISAPTSSITMNALDIEVQSASISSEGVTASASNIEYDKEEETVSFIFHHAVPGGQATLSLQFTGILNEQLFGFYRATYQGPNGEPKVMATTQFEATDARRAFPCWDEPAVKATFECTLVVPSHLSAISNTPIVSETPEGDGLRRVQFAETPPMSTYLLAFIVGELDSIEGRSEDGTLIRVLTTPGKVEQGRFALDTAIRLLAYYNDYFGIPYPLEKLDHLAIPDFAAGAMENWGAITYRETALLYDPANSSPATRQRIAEVVAHEMAHMWFGDLVTMAWWNDLWLNESFASWMGTKAVDHLFPEWSMWTQFIVDDLNSGLSLDGLENTHPIEQEVNDPAQIGQLFDAISYSKGASVLRMLEQFIGPDKFRAGLYKYLDAHRYDNARGADLWQAMEDESQQPVIQMMDSWVQQPGYPVLRAEVQRGDQAQVRLTQQRFLYTGLKEDDTLWQVPVGLASAGGEPTAPVVMGDRVSALPMTEPAPANGGSRWVKVNPGHTGFYRVQYDDEEWQRFIPAIESGELAATDRLGLQGDAYALARSRLIPATQFLLLAQAYRNEETYSVWADLIGNLRQVEMLIAQEPFLPQYQAMGRHLVGPIAGKVGWEPKAGEGHLQVLLRATALGYFGALGDEETIAEAQRRFARFLEEPSSLSPDLKGAVYALAAQAGDEETFSAMHRLSQETPLQEEKVRLLQSLTRFSDTRLLQRTLELSLSPEDVRMQDTVAMVLGVAGNRNNGAQMAWDFVKSNWGEFDRRYGSGGFAIMRLVGLTSNFVTAEASQGVERFFQENPTPAASRSIQQCLERIDLNIRWLERNRDDLGEWLAR